MIKGLFDEYNWNRDIALQISACLLLANLVDPFECVQKLKHVIGVKL